MTSQVETGSSKDEILALTGIRGVAAFWVVGFHFQAAVALLFPVCGGLLTAFFLPGFLGVDLFFLLSGFIIAYNYQDKLHPFRISAYKEFLWARLARLYPVHLATLFACLILFVGAKVTKAHLNTGATNWGLWDFVANVGMVHAWTLHYHLSWNFPSWSISCEWLAYLCFPALAAFASLKWSRPSLWMFVALLLGGQLGLNLIHWEGSNWRFSGIAFEFPAGVCLCQIYRLRNEGVRPFRFPFQMTIVMALGAATVACSTLNVADSLLIPLLALLLYSLAIDSRGVLGKILSSRIACYWGRVSYSLYMTHTVTSMVLIRFVHLDTFERHPLAVRLGVCIFYFGTLATVAMIVYHLIEEPARRQMRRIYPKYYGGHGKTGAPLLYKATSTKSTNILT